MSGTSIETTLELWAASLRRQAFNEAIDRATAESVAHFTKKLAYTRNLFPGILGHDLRNPIGSASMSAEMMLINGGLNHKQILSAS
jgi:signal transduction histidine kinase